MAGEASGVRGAAEGLSRLRVDGPSTVDAPTPSIGAFPTEIQTQILSHLNVEELISLRASGCNYRDIVTNNCQETWKRLHDANWVNGKRRTSADLQAWSKLKGWNVHPEEIADGNWYNEFVRRARLDRCVRGRILALDVEKPQGNEVWYGLMADGLDILDSLIKISRPLRRFSSPLEIQNGVCGKVLTGINRVVRYQEWKFLIDASTGAFPTERGKIRLEEGAIAITGFYDDATVMMRNCKSDWMKFGERRANKELDKLATFVKERLSQRSCTGDYSVREVLEAMKFLFESPGAPNFEGCPTPFTGNVDDYYNHTNSLINYCLFLRKGIPMTLSIIYVAVVRRICGIELDIIGLPGHIVVGAPSDGLSNADRVFVDPFHQGRILSYDDCRDIVARYNLEFSDDMVRPISNRQVWERILRNLIHCHSMQAMRDDNGEDSDSDHRWKIALPLRIFLSDSDYVDNLRLLLAAPGWCPQYC
ncbi:hypothetical protein ACHAXT_011721 [Thalassiosira profunda]